MKNRYTLPDTDESAEKAQGEDQDQDNSDHKNKTEGEKMNEGLGMKYWWTCYAGAQNDGKGCNFWKVMDVKAEGRGPFVGEV